LYCAMPWGPRFPSMKRAQSGVRRRAGVCPAEDAVVVPCGPSKAWSEPGANAGTSTPGSCRSRLRVLTRSTEALSGSRSVSPCSSAVTSSLLSDQEEDPGVGGSKPTLVLAPCRTPTRPGNKAAAVGGPRSVVVLDWDDTLFPTSWIKSRFNQPMLEVTLPEAVRQMVERAIVQVVEAALRVGRVYIVTNSLEGWVQTCLQVVPGVAEVLQRVKIVHARTQGDTLANNSTETMKDWKVKAVTRILSQEFTGRSSGVAISIGDSDHDSEAVRLAASSLKLECSVRTQLLLVPRTLAATELALLLCVLAGRLAGVARVKMDRCHLVQLHPGWLAEQGLTECARESRVTLEMRAKRLENLNLSDGLSEQSMSWLSC